jgi:hypothetical protein
VSLSRVYPSLLVLRETLLDKDALGADNKVVVKPRVLGKRKGKVFVVQPEVSVVVPQLEEAIKELRKNLNKSLGERWKPTEEGGTRNCIEQGHFELYKLATALDPRYLDFQLLEREGARLWMQTSVLEAFETRAELLLKLIRGDPKLKGTTLLQRLGDARGTGGQVAGAQGPETGAGATSTHDEDGSDQEDDGDFEMVVEDTHVGHQFHGATSDLAPVPSTVTTLTVEEAVKLLKEQLRGELGRYYAAEHKGIGVKDDPLAWWGARVADFPIMAKQALLILQVPASSACVERLFSYCGLQSSRLRTSLAPERLEKIMVIGRNWDDRLLTLAPAQLARIQQKVAASKDGKAAAKRKRNAEGVAKVAELPPPKLPRTSEGNVVVST